MGPETPGPAALIGRVIGGYRLERVLGTGVTGAVLLGRRSDAPDHLAAIRVLMLPLQTSDAARAEFRERLAHEAQTLFALRHPHILRVYAVGEDIVSDFPYMALPYMSGSSLAARLASGALPLQDAAQQLRWLASALDFAHTRGAVHGGVKPTNALYDPQGQVSLADFGIARLFEPVYGIGVGGLGQGSATYMAPEQALGEPIGPATDIYSLGVVLYQMVTGRVPFEGVSPTAVMLKVLQQIPPAPRSFRPDLPEAAEAAILRALAKEPSARFATAGALAEAFLHGLSAAAAPTLADRKVEAATPTPAQPRAPEAVVPEAAVPEAATPEADPFPSSDSAQSEAHPEAERVASAPAHTFDVSPAATPDLSEAAAPLADVMVTIPATPADQASREARSSAALAASTDYCASEPTLAPTALAAPDPMAPHEREASVAEADAPAAAQLDPAVASGRTTAPTSPVAAEAEPAPKVAFTASAAPAESGASAVAEPSVGVTAAAEPAGPPEQEWTPKRGETPDSATDNERAELPAPPSADDATIAPTPTSAGEEASAADATPAPSAPVIQAPPVVNSPGDDTGLHESLGVQLVPPASSPALANHGIRQIFPAKRYETSPPRGDPPDPPTPTVAPKVAAPPDPGSQRRRKPALVRNMTLVIFFAVIALAAIAVVNALGVFQALLMGVILALLAFIVIAVPSRPAATSAGKGSPDTAPEGRGMGQVSQVRSLSGVPAHS